MNKDKVFNIIRYANCWEDAELLLEGLNIQEGSVGLSICSGGDNTLALLTQNPKQIYAIDLNPLQIFCLELKINAFKYLTYDELLELLGIVKSNRRMQLYHEIASSLSDDARAFFSQNEKIIRKGIVHAGKFEKYFQIFRKYVMPLVHSKKTIHQFLSFDHLDEQKKYYEETFDNRRWKCIYKVFFSETVMGKLGRDKSFFKYVDCDSVSDALKKRVEIGVFNTLNKTNPYLTYIFLGNFTPETLPVYLRKENYETIKRNIDRITIIKSDILSLPDLSLDFMNLSDIFEYMDDHMFLENIKKVNTMANPKCKVIYWNMLSEKVIKYGDFKTDLAQSEKLFIQDKAFFYKDVYVVSKENQLNYELRISEAI